MYRSLDNWIADVRDAAIGYSIAGFSFAFGVWVFWVILGALAALVA